MFTDNSPTGITTNSDNIAINTTSDGNTYLWYKDDFSRLKCAHYDDSQHKKSWKDVQLGNDIAVYAVDMAAAGDFMAFSSLYPKGSHPIFLMRYGTDGTWKALYGAPELPPTRGGIISMAQVADKQYSIIYQVNRLDWGYQCGAWTEDDGKNWQHSVNFETMYSPTVHGGGYGKQVIAYNEGALNSGEVKFNWLDGVEISGYFNVSQHKITGRPSIQMIDATTAYLYYTESADKKIYRIKLTRAGEYGTEVGKPESCGGMSTKAGPRVTRMTKGSMLVHLGKTSDRIWMSVDSDA